MRRRLLAGVLLVAGCTTTGGEEGGPNCVGKCDGATTRWGVNDVSVLFPLPANAAARTHNLWLMPKPGEQGPYVPADAIGTLPQPNADLPGNLGWPAAMITSLRFDPCFPRLGGATCQAQLRLVAQPVITNATSVSMLDDAAAHLFYVLDDTEAAEVVAELAAIRDASPVPTNGPLAVHPALAADPDGEIARDLRALVVAHCRADNLIRITTNSFAFDNWTFSKFDRVDGELVRQDLVGMTETGKSQGWLRQAFVESLDDPSGTISPAPTNGFTYFLSIASFANGAPNDASAAATAAARLNEIENPELTDPETTDCVSCHLATQARLFASRNGVSFETATRFVPPSGVDTSLGLVPALQGNLGATIAFGYHTHGSTPSVPSISQRTVNESAAIAAFLSRE